LEEQFGRDNWDMARGHIEPYLVSKLEEFRLLGLNHLTMDELWSFVKETLVKRKKDSLQLHELVNFIMRLSVNDYLNKIRLEMFKGINLEQIKERS
jgi:hypothetical protein